jgi:biotin carboxyl carrier protein
MKYFLKQADNYLEIDVQGTNGILNIAKGDRFYAVDMVRLDDRRYSVIVNNRSFVVEANSEKNALRLLIDQYEWVIPVLNRQQRIESEILGSSDVESSEGEIRAPMPGMILRIEVEPGQVIEAWQPLLVIEAMKMENEIRALISGTVTEILAQPRQAVEKDDLLIRIGN